VPRFLGRLRTPEAADTESGQLTFNNSCRTCHTIKEGDNRLIATIRSSVRAGQRLRRAADLGPTPPRRHPWTEFCCCCCARPVRCASRLVPTLVLKHQRAAVSRLVATLEVRSPLHGLTPVPLTPCGLASTL
jgi:hypothetical protein